MANLKFKVGAGWLSIPSIKGDQGIQGDPGVDGTAITDVSSNKVGKTTTVTVTGTFPTSPYQFNIQDGVDGTGTGDMLSTNNLSDVADVPTSRTNLGLGTTDDVEFGSVKLNGGVLSYDANRQMLQYTNPDGTTNDVGAEVWFSEGKASSAIANGACVQFAGVQGNHYLFKTAVPSEINANPSLFMGIATSDIAKNAWGKVTHFGVVHDINTNGWTMGTILWFDSVNGGLTATKPNYPNAQIQVCAVVVSSSTVGSIIVRPTVYQDAYTRSETDDLLNVKAPINNPTFTGTVSGITKAMVGLGNVDNTSDANKPISTATQTALDGKAPLASPTFTGSPTLSGVGRLIADSASAGTDIYNIWSGTQAQYDAIGTKDANTLYFIS